MSRIPALVRAVLLLTLVTSSLALSRSRDAHSDAALQPAAGDFDADEADANEWLADGDSLLSLDSGVQGGACGASLCATTGPWQAACKASLCYPLCLSVFDVEVKGSSAEAEFNAQLAEPTHQNAIQGLFLGVGCSMAKCCAKDARLAEWTESKMQGGQVYGLPLPFCKQMVDRKAACKACKATVKVKPKGAKTCENHFKPLKIGAAEAVWKRAKLKSTPGKHKSYKEKCLAVTKAVSGAKGSMESAFKKSVCGCLGCCDDQKCPYRVAFSTATEADDVKNDKGTGLDA